MGSCPSRRRPAPGRWRWRNEVDPVLHELLGDGVGDAEVALGVVVLDDDVFTDSVPGVFDGLDEAGAGASGDGTETQRCRCGRDWRAVAVGGETGRHGGASTIRPSGRQPPARSPRPRRPRLNGARPHQQQSAWSMSAPLAGSSPRRTDGRTVAARLGFSACPGLDVPAPMGSGSDRRLCRQCRPGAAGIKPGVAGIKSTPRPLTQAGFGVGRRFGTPFP